VKFGYWTAAGCAACLLAVATPTGAMPPAANGEKATTAQPSDQKAVPTDEVLARRNARIEAEKAAMRNEPKVDVNNASRAEIQKVLGISEADAGKVIAARPLHARTDLVTKAGLPEGVYLAVRSRVIINEPRKRAPKK